MNFPRGAGIPAYISCQRRCTTSRGRVAVVRFEGASQSDLRRYNEERIVRHIIERPWCTQSEISRGVGLTRAAVSKLLGTASSDDQATSIDGKDARELDGASARLRGVLRERRERSSHHYAVIAEAGDVVSVDFGALHVRIRFCDLLGELKGETPLSERDVLNDPNGAMSYVADVINQRCPDRRQVAGIAVGVPFAIQDGKPVTDSPWKWLGLERHVEEHLGWRPQLRIHSDVQLGAVAEMEAARVASESRKLGAETLTLIYVKWSGQVSVAITIDGSLYLGKTGIAGTIGHGPAEAFSAGSVPCEHCKKHCVTSVASIPGILADLRDKEIDGEGNETRAQELLALARKDADVQHRLDFAGTTLGRALGHAVNVLDPDVVVIGGAIKGRDFSLVLGSIREGIAETADAEINRTLDVIGGRETGEAAVKGGVALALRELAVPYLLDNRNDIAERFPSSRPTRSPKLKYDALLDVLVHEHDGITVADAAKHLGVARARALYPAVSRLTHQQRLVKREGKLYPTNRR